MKEHIKEFFKKRKLDMILMAIWAAIVDILPPIVEESGFIFNTLTDIYFVFFLKYGLFIVILLIVLSVIFGASAAKNNKSMINIPIFAAETAVSALPLFFIEKLENSHTYFSLIVIGISFGISLAVSFFSYCDNMQKDNK